MGDKVIKEKKLELCITQFTVKLKENFQTERMAQKINKETNIKGSGTWTATFSGSWVGGTYFGVHGFEENGTVIFAIHDDAHTKMVAIAVAETANGWKRIEGRYTPKNALVKMNKDSVFAAWQSTAGRGVAHDKYQLSEVKQN